MNQRQLDVREATSIIQSAELDLGYVLDRGQRRDLLKDNTTWDGKYCDEIEGAVFAIEQAERRCA